MRAIFALGGLAALTALPGCAAGVFGAAALGTLWIFEEDVANQRHEYRPTGSHVVNDTGTYPVETRYVYQKDTGALRYFERVVDVNGSKVECGDSCMNAVAHFQKVRGRKALTE